MTITNFYNQDVNEIAKEFSSNLDIGLNDKQVADNRSKFGDNKLVTAKRKNWIQIFFEQYKDILMIVLLISAIISLIISIFPADGKSWGKQLTMIDGWEDFILIIVVTIINAILGTIQVIKSQKSLDSLKKLSSPKTKVIRNNSAFLIDSKELVVGDILILEAGDLISADARLIESHNLRVNESSLTGESEAIIKNNLIIKENNIPIGDRLNCVFSGCLVNYGRAKAIVTAVGSETEIGKINKLLIETTETKTPLQVNLNRLAKLLMWIVLAITLALFVLNISKIAFTNKEPQEILGCFSSTINFSIALAVAVIPEALSSIVTIVLSLSTKKMAKQNAIVKNLKAVEGLGSVSVICSDKTGTITQNKMTVKGFFVNGKSYLDNEINIKDNIQLNLIKYSVLCSDAKVKDGNVIGDPTEICLVEYYNRLNFDSNKLSKENPRICELSFDSERMMMSTLIKWNNKNLMITKGALDKILIKCNTILENNQVRKITKQDIAKINEANLAFSQKGQRVLCFAIKNINKKEIAFSDEDDFTFIGLITMIDPPRPEVIEAIKECHIAGIKVVMITGDHQSTATAIAKQIGIFLDNDWSMNGVELAKTSVESLTKNVTRYSVYARVSPEDKIKIVRALQANNKIVSMTGDGVNDAPALKQADIGVAMGITGSEVSKEAASIILTDDNFSTIVSAIKFGRSIYNNIKNSIRYLLTGNLATVFVAIVITLFSLGIRIIASPFSAMQLLFLNLLTDSFPALSLGLEKYKNNVIYEKPRLANEFFINKKFIINLLKDSLIMTVIVLIAFFSIFYLLDPNTIDTSNIIGKIDTEEYIQNIRFECGSNAAFLTLGMCRIFYSFSCKSEKGILFSKEMFNNPYLIGSFFLGIGLIFLIFYTPGLNTLFLDIHTGTSSMPEVYKHLELGNLKWNLIAICFVFASSMLFFAQASQYFHDWMTTRKNTNIIKA